MHKKILIMLEDSEQLKSVKSVLHNMNFKNFHIEQSIDSAWNHLQKNHEDSHKTDLVIADFAPASNSGLNFLKMLRNDSLLKNTPFIMLIPANEKSLIHKSVKAGANNFVSLPIVSSELIEAINKQKLY